MRPAMRHAGRALVVACAVACLAPSPARAQGEAEQKTAETRFQEGLQRARKGDFDGARLAFAQAYAVLQKPDVLFNLALSELKHRQPAIDI